MAYFEPIIGSGFSDIGAQRRFWAQQNAGVESANIARANAVQQNANDYFARLATLREAAARRNADVQLARDAEARQYAWMREQAAARAAENVDQRRWLEQQNRQAIEERRGEIAAQERMAQNKLDLQREFAQQDIDLNGQAIAAQYPAIQRQYAAANQAVTALEDEQSRLEDEQKALDDKAEKKTWYGIRAGLTDEEKTRQNDIITRLGELKKLLNPKSELYRNRDKADRALQTFQDQLTGTGYSIDEDTGVIRHNTGKAWKFNTAVNDAARSATGTAGGNALSPLMVGPGTTMEMGNQLSKVFPTTATTPPPVAAAPPAAGFRGAGAGTTWAQPPVEAFRGAGAGATWEAAPTPVAAPVAAPVAQPRQPVIGEIMKSGAGTHIWNGRTWVGGPDNPKVGDVRNLAGVDMVFTGQKWEPYSNVAKSSPDELGRQPFGARDVGGTESFFRGTTPVSQQNRFTGEVPVAPVKASEREYGRTYWTPLGPMQWQGGGWQFPS